MGATYMECYVQYPIECLNLVSQVETGKINNLDVNKLYAYIFYRAYGNPFAVAPPRPGEPQGAPVAPEVQFSDENVAKRVKCGRVLRGTLDRHSGRTCLRERSPQPIRTEVANGYLYVHLDFVRYDNSLHIRGKLTESGRPTVPIKNYEITARWKQYCQCGCLRQLEHGRVVATNLGWMFTTCYEALIDIQEHREAERGRQRDQRRRGAPSHARVYRKGRRLGTVDVYAADRNGGLSPRASLPTVVAVENPGPDTSGSPGVTMQNVLSAPPSWVCVRSPPPATDARR